LIYQTTVREVRSKNLTRKKDGKPFTLYEVTDHTGVAWTTGRRDLAEEANNLIGQPVEIQGHEETNAAGYKNYYLDDIRAGGAGTNQALPSPDSPFGPPPGAPGFPPPQQPVQQPPAQAQQTIQPVDGQVTELLKQTLIMRQTAGKVAAQISPSAVEFWSNCDALYTYFSTGQKPNIIPPAGVREPAPQPPPPGGRFITDAILSDPGPEPEKPAFASTFDDDIPFDRTTMSSGRWGI